VVERGLCGQGEDKAPSPAYIRELIWRPRNAQGLGRRVDAIEIMSPGSRHEEVGGWY
jgi:hypothetical protein